jgi:hypothetical protein
MYDNFLCKQILKFKEILKYAFVIMYVQYV